MPGDGDVYVSGQFRGIARLDARDLSLRERFDVPVFDGVHLFALPG